MVEWFYMDSFILFLTSPTLALIVSILLVLCVLLQRSGKDLDGAFGGGSANDDSVSYERRGIEGVFYNGTIVLGFVLLGILIVHALVG